MTSNEIELAEIILQRYSERIGEIVRPDLLRNIPLVISGDANSANYKMWKSVGMANTHEDLKKCCEMLSTFELIADEGPSRIPSKRRKINDYKITKLGLTVANMENGLYNFVSENGKIDFSKLMTMSNTETKKQSSISNTFINSPVGQFQQANQTKSSNQNIKFEKEVNTKNILNLNEDKVENKSTLYKILEKWWWAFIIPLAVTVIGIGIEKEWF